MGCSVHCIFVLSWTALGSRGGLAYLACRFSISMLFSLSILHKSSFCFRVSSRTISQALSSCSFNCSSRALAL